MTTFPGPCWYLDEHTSIEKIRSDDYGMILGNGNGTIHTLPSDKSRCVYHRINDEFSWKNGTDTLTTLISFLFNSFRESDPVQISHVYMFGGKRKKKLQQILPVTSEAGSYGKCKLKYKVSAEAEQTIMSSSFKVLQTSLKNNSQASLPLDRFNAAMIRPLFRDKVVDLTIALESLIDGSTELRYRVALYGAITAEPDLSKREEAFETLLKLYDARSAFVHGATMSEREYTKKIQPISDNWPRISELVSKAIYYYCIYLYENDMRVWPSHLKRLAMGIDKTDFDKEG